MTSFYFKHDRRTRVTIVTRVSLLLAVLVWCYRVRIRVRVGKQRSAREWADEMIS